MKSVKNFYSRCETLVTVHTCAQQRDFADATHSKSAKSAAGTVSYGIFSSKIPTCEQLQTLPSDAALLITPLYLYNSVSRILSANAFIRSSIPRQLHRCPGIVCRLHHRKPPRQIEGFVHI